MSSSVVRLVPLEIGCLGKYDVKRSNVRQGSDRVLSVRASVASKTLEYPKAKVKQSEDVRIGVLGASGYTGAEIVRLLANHPHLRITLMTADRKAGQSFGSVFPHLIIQDFRLRNINEYEEWYGLPHKAPELQSLWSKEGADDRSGVGPANTNTKASIKYNGDMELGS